MANLYLILLCLFNILFASGHPIARYLFVFIFGLNCFWTVKLLKMSQPIYIKRLNVLLGMFIVYGLVSIFQGNRFIILMV